MSRRSPFTPFSFSIAKTAVALLASFVLSLVADDKTSQHHFDTVIAPILSEHCLECHDSATREGKLDLSKKSTAFGSDNHGPFLIPGSSEKSRIWESVEDDSMPENRPPLSASEKQKLRHWIDAGAVWPGEEIDPLAHLRAGGESSSLPRRLTREEYIATVRAATGVELEKEAIRQLPADQRAEGFTNTAYHLTVDLRHVQAYAALGRIIAERMNPAPFLAKGNSTDDDALGAIIDRAAERLLRGPLSNMEREAYLELAREEAAASSRGDAAASSARLVVQAMLQSPRFLYRIESQRGDGEPKPVTPYELAARLSYLVWGSPPDEELRRAATEGKLDSEEEIARQVDRLLADPRAIDRSLTFARDWLDLDRLDSLRPGAKRFPDWTPELSADLKAETLAYFREVVWEEKLPLARLYNAPFTFVSPRLTRHYDFPAPQKSEGPRPLVSYDFTKNDKGRVMNRGSLGESFHLGLDKKNTVEWKADGEYRFKDAASLQAAKPAEAIAKAIKKSGEFTVSAWITPANTKQKGPARIVSISRGSSERNLTLGQEGDRYEVRVRAKGTGKNGTTGWRTGGGTVKTERTHVMVVFEKSGQACVFLNGKEAASKKLPGDLRDWRDDFQLVLGNETSGDRPWLGTFHEVAIYDRALPPDQPLPEAAPAWRKIDLTGVPGRGGLLTQGSLLSIGGDDASMVTRGLYVLEEVLGGGVTSAPPGTDTTPIPPKPGQSRRGVSETRMSKGECGGCHAKFEPLAFGLEKFDALGSWNDQDEHGNAQREDGQVLFPGAAEPVNYETVGELMDLLAGNDRVARTLTRKVAQFAAGRPLGNADAAVLDTIHRRATADGGTWPALIKAIALSDLTRRTPTEDPQS